MEAGVLFVLGVGVINGTSPTRLLRIPDVAEVLQVAQFTAYELVRRGTLPAVHIGRLVRVREDDLRAFIESRATNGNNRDRSKQDGAKDRVR